MNATFKNIDDVKSFLHSFDKNGLDGRELMREVGQETMMAMIAVRGASAIISEWLGFSNPGVLSVATGDFGWRTVGTRGPNGGTVKIKGTLPFKTAFAISKVHGDPDPEEFDPASVTWAQFKDALEVMGDDWLELLFKRLGGRDSDGGKSFTSWIESNTAKDEADKRAADPVYQLKENNRVLQGIIRDKDIEVEKLQARIEELERRIAAGPRKTNGGILTASMKKLLIQRFHPDRMNGNDETMYTALAQWINALDTVD